MKLGVIATVCTAALFALSLFSLSNVRADTTTTEDKPFAASARIGTLGGGLELGWRSQSTPFGVRLNGQGFGINVDNVYSNNFRGGNRFYSYNANVSYSGTARLLNFGLVGDYYPFSGRGFRLSVGEVYNRNKIDATATPRGRVTVAGQSFTDGAIGGVTGHAQFNDFDPMISLGYVGHLADRLGISFEIGAMYQGHPRVSIATSGPINSIPTLAEQIQGQRSRIYNGINYPFYPIVEIGLSYLF